MTSTENIQIIYAEDCGNNFRTKLIKDFYIAFTTQNAALVLDYVENDVHWQITDKALILGKEQFIKEVHQLANLRIKKLHIKNIIVNGRTSAVNGVIHSEEHKNYNFCDIYHFTNASENAKIQRISTYMNNSSMEFANVYYKNVCYN